MSHNHRAWVTALLLAASGCFDPRPVGQREDAAPPPDATPPPADAAAPPEPLDCEVLARPINARPDELPTGACRPATPPCEWRNVCFRGAESTLRCACETGEGGAASWRCVAAGDAPCRSWADAATDTPRPARVDVTEADAEDAAFYPSWKDCRVLEAMFEENLGIPPGGACRRDGARCEWIEFCLHGRAVNITCRCSTGGGLGGPGWGCDARDVGRICGGAPDAGVDVAAE